MKVVVLGASGMLGSMVVDWLGRDGELRVIATLSSPAGRQFFEGAYPAADWRVLNLDLDRSPASLRQLLAGAAWVVNCIGVIKPFIHEDIPAEIERAIRINALFPHALARAAADCEVQVLQIATDCVYSGAQGGYLENRAHDAPDVYGKTKSLGEAAWPHVHHLRASILGPEPLRHVSLLDWFLQRPHRASITGYTNHRWNGVTTLHFARLCHGAIREGLGLTHMQHVVPSGTVTKEDLMHRFAVIFNREDVEIIPAAATVAADRTLATLDPAANARLWAAAGYRQPPSLPEMLAELAEFDYRCAPQLSRRRAGA
jgi:dTDP-4-dehydrorhamnose reductase